MTPTLVRVALLAIVMTINAVSKPHPRKPTFEEVRPFLYHNESTNGQFKVRFNPNCTADLGDFGINSAHFVAHPVKDKHGKVVKRNGKTLYAKDEVGMAFDSIFVRFKVGLKLHERVVATITNNKLNEALARKLYELRGIKAWASLPKFQNQYNSLITDHSRRGSNPALRKTTNANIHLRQRNGYQR